MNRTPATHIKNITNTNQIKLAYYISWPSPADLNGYPFGLQIIRILLNPIAAAYSFSAVIHNGFSSPTNMFRVRRLMRWHLFKYGQIHSCVCSAGTSPRQESVVASISRNAASLFSGTDLSKSSSSNDSILQLTPTLQIMLPCLCLASQKHFSRAQDISVSVKMLSKSCVR